MCERHGRARIGLQALGVKAGSKVALPNLTFWATFEAIVQLGATPVLVDVDPDDLQVSLEQLRSAHEKHRFDAAILVHLFGWTSARLAEIRAFCKERDVALLEDGAQCFGVEAGGEPVLAKADVATLSFYPAKVIGGAMDGGALTLQTEAQEALVRSLCNHGRSDHYSYAHVGWNSRMGGIQAAFIARVLDEVPAILSSRRAAAEFYRERLGAANARVKVYGPPAGVVENGYLNVVTVEGRTGAELVESLKTAGIGAARTYPETMNVQPPVKRDRCDCAWQSRRVEALLRVGREPAAVLRHPRRRARGGSGGAARRDLSRSPPASVRPRSRTRHRGFACVRRTS